MSKARGLSEMELNLRTVLLQQIAGQSRSVVNNAIQTTKLVVSFFLQHGHKTFEEILDDMQAQLPAVEPEPSSASQRSAEKADNREYEKLRQFIFNKVLTTNAGDHKSIRTQSCIDVLVQAGLSIDELQKIYLQVNRDEVKYYTEMRNRLEDSYRNYGPSEMWFANFIGYIAEYLERRTTERNQLDVPPLWYRCRNCGDTGQHWCSTCPLQVNTFGSDTNYIICYISTLNTGCLNPQIIDSLVGLKQHIEEVFLHNVQQNDKITHELYTFTVKAIILSLAKMNIPGRLIHSCKYVSEEAADAILYSKLSGVLPELVDVNALKTIIKGYLDNYVS